MSESCTLNLVNNSGRSLDRVMMWHTSLEPGPADLVPPEAVIRQENVSPGATLTASVPLSHSPTDYWSGGVVFEGDGTNYLICGEIGDAYKEYEVSDGSTITFTLNGYTSGTTNQADITIAYSGDEGGTALLLNPTQSAVDSFGSDIVESLAEALE